nr:hypothetical protein [Paenibacillus bovis]
MTWEYSDLKEIKKKIEDNFPIYWKEVFGIVNKGEVVLPNGIRVTKDNSKEVKILKATINKWNKEIDKYQEEFVDYFDLELFNEDNDEVYEFQEFKDIFATKLWTVKGALRTPDPDLDLYKSKFQQTTGAQIFNTVREILLETDNYMRNVAEKVNFKRVKTIQDLKLDFLDEENMFLPGIIGLGIRSELLHRIYPSHFAIMTRRSGWAMYYLTDESEEFVIDEEQDGKARTSFYWEYEYDRFTYLCNFLCNLLEENLNKYNITLNQQKRFGYINLFLNEIFQQNKEKADFLTKWKLVRA